MLVIKDLVLGQKNRRLQYPLINRPYPDWIHVHHSNTRPVLSANTESRKGPQRCAHKSADLPQLSTTHILSLVWQQLLSQKLQFISHPETPSFPDDSWTACDRCYRCNIQFFLHTLGPPPEQCCPTCPGTSSGPRSAASTCPGTTQLDDWADTDPRK